MFSFLSPPGLDDRATVTLTQTWDTAVRIHQGQLSPPAAFRAGLVKVRGDARRLVELAATLEPLRPATTALREHTIGA